MTLTGLRKGIGRTLAGILLIATLGACAEAQNREQKSAGQTVSQPTQPERERPPEIVDITGPKTVLVGTAVNLEAIVSSTNGDPFEVKWDQLKNPDKYVGKTFISSSPVELHKSGNAVYFTPEWPGKYRVKVTVSDDDGESTKSTDVIAKFKFPPFDVQGIAQNWWGPPSNNDEKFAIPNIDRAKKLGANFIQFIPTYYQATPKDNEMKPCSEFEEGTDRWCTPLPDSKLREWIRYAKSRDMGVLLKIIVDSTNVTTTGHSIINPANPDKGFESYSSYILKYAALAQEEKVDWISIGNELSQVQSRTPYWNRIIDAVKEVYTGRLTYSDNRILLRDRRNYAQFWNRLDALSENMFYEGSDKNKNPSVEEMQSYIIAQMRGDLSGESKKYGRGVIATELGKPDYDGTNYDFTTASNRIPDTQEQADWIDAMLRSLYSLKNEGVDVKGAFMWNMHIRSLPSRPGTGTQDFRDTPAEQLISYWFGGEVPSQYP